MEDNKIFIAGDSTAATYDESRYPMQGWGHELGKFLDSDIAVINKAICGRSTKSFIDEGRLLEIEKQIKKGDFLFIQFGHNDGKKEDETRYTRPFIEYKENLKIFIDTVRAKEGTPILLTSVCRRNFNKYEKLINTHGDYIQAMIETAQETNTALIDTHKMTQDFFNSIGAEKSKEYYAWFKPGIYENYPDGLEDNTHFNDKGVTAISKMIAEDFLKLYLAS